MKEYNSGVGNGHGKFIDSEVVNGLMEKLDIFEFDLPKVTEQIQRVSNDYWRKKNACQQTHAPSTTKQKFSRLRGKLSSVEKDLKNLSMYETDLLISGQFHAPGAPPMMDVNENIDQCRNHLKHCKRIIDCALKLEPASPVPPQEPLRAAIRRLHKVFTGVTGKNLKCTYDAYSDENHFGGEFYRFAESFIKLIDHDAVKSNSQLAKQIKQALPA